LENAHAQCKTKLEERNLELKTDMERWHLGKKADIKEWLCGMADRHIDTYDKVRVIYLPLNYIAHFLNF